MLVQQITNFLQTIAPLPLQEDYDNAGLLTGNKTMLCTGALISLDCTEAIVDEAVNNNCNLIIAHHPIVFKGLKKINGSNYVERTIIKAIKNDIAIYAIHTNLDNVLAGVNGKIAAMLGLQNIQILAPKNNLLQKLKVFVPIGYEDKVTEAMFTAGAGNIGNYSECSFSMEGISTFTPGTGANPFKGNIGVRETGKEIKVEVIFPNWLQKNIVTAMVNAHTYEEVAHDIYNLDNVLQTIGSGVIGELDNDVDEQTFLQQLANLFKVPAIRHTNLLGKKIKKVALCGGAGSFLINNAKTAGADVFITADVKYHEFFDADNQLLIADIGHYESEQFTIDLLYDVLNDNFPNFAFQKTGVNTNSTHYFIPYKN